jgi:hypothetical protein
MSTRSRCFVLLIGLSAAPAVQADEENFKRNLTFEQRPAVGAVQPRPGDLQVSAWFDRTDGTYARGETVRIFVKSNRPSFVAVVTTGPKGDVALLYPNALQKPAQLDAGQTLEVPPPNSTGRITVSPPYGTELVTVLVSDQKFDFLAERDLDPAGDFAAVKGGVATMVQRANEMNRRGERHIAVIERQLRTVAARTGAETPAPVLADGKPATSGPEGTVAAGPPASNGTAATAVAATVPPGSDAGPAKPAAAPPPAKPTLAMPRLDNPFPLDLKADLAAYKTGDKASLRVVPGRACYLSVFMVASDGSARRIFPNRTAPQAAVSAASPVQIGGGVSPVQIEARPSGPLTFVAVCSIDGQPVARTEDDPSGGFARAGDAESLSRDLAEASRRPAGSIAMGSVAVTVAE